MSFSCLCVAAMWSAAGAESEPPSSEQLKTKKPERAENQAREYAPGVRINWKERTVELEAKVVLREGMLELLACSPQTREHESVFVVRARPLHVYQALGLIGLEPGNPVRYDARAERLIPARGAELEIGVVCKGEDDSNVRPAEKFLINAETQEPPEKLKWVFAGSRKLGEDRFGADVEGTVVTVVDFQTALISLDTLHSADNDQLWMAANPQTVPPVDTPCTLLIRGAEAEARDTERDEGTEGRRDEEEVPQPSRTPRRD